MNQKFDITVITGILRDYKEYVGTQLQAKDHYFQFWDCEKSEWRAISYDTKATISFKPQEVKTLYGVEYDEEVRKFKVFEHEEGLYSCEGRVVMNNYMTEKDAEDLCWKYNQVRL